ncbi:unnamed protein product [Durusdinium trenchii]|uniref:Serine/threonine-protein phosphatase n=1 Tax=Durusdinium trenchii TaxID=1381693 RepID=A0ABP0Q1W6_9DINO
MAGVVKAGVAWKAGTKTSLATGSLKPLQLHERSHRGWSPDKTSISLGTCDQPSLGSYDVAASCNRQEVRPMFLQTVETVAELVEALQWRIEDDEALSLDPSPRNQYLFNGDFAPLALKVLYPRSVHLNRGNHEALRMNALYGFQWLGHRHETENKYGNAPWRTGSSDELDRMPLQNFHGNQGSVGRHLPLCTLVNSAVFVVHGGLSSKEGVKLSDLARVNRLREPDETAEQLMLDLLWSDPMDSPGFCTSPRGGGILFGPDVTKRFCEENGLCCIIRSHEMKSEGYEWQHMNRCLTIFSAPNYCDVCGNLGAVCSITPSQARTVRLQDLNVRTFECSPHPDEPHPVNMMFRPF